MTQERGWGEFTLLRLCRTLVNVETPSLCVCGGEIKLLLRCPLVFPHASLIVAMRQGALRRSPALRVALQTLR